MADLPSDALDTGPDVDEPLVVVSSDCHVSPDLDRDLRTYCPVDHLDDFDAWLDRTADLRAAGQKGFVFGGDTSDPRVHDIHTWNLHTTGQFDIHQRIRDMDRDGVAGEIIFHGSAPFHPFPFMEVGIGVVPRDLDLTSVGLHIYNRWLADFVSVEPERHVGLAQVPMWDIGAAVSELEWAHDHGLRGVNFPQPRADILPYEDPAWEPFWSVCEERGMALANHGGGGASTPRTSGPLGQQIYMVESNALSHVSPLVRLVFGGVFANHPGLRLIQTEQVGDWYGRVIADLDSRWEKWDYLMQHLLPKRPSEYARAQYFVGASFHSRAEAMTAILEGWASNVMWGSDYPHPEGTWRYQPDPDETPTTRLAMRNTYSGLDHNAVRGMLGENAVGVYGFDRKKLSDAARRIAAPTLRELSQPIDEIPAHWGLAFRASTHFV